MTAALLMAAAVWLLVPPGPRPADPPTRMTPTQRAAMRDVVLVAAAFEAMGLLAACAAIVILRGVLPRLAAPEVDDTAMSVDDVIVAADFLSVCAGAGLTTLNALGRLGHAEAGTASTWASAVLARHAAGMPLDASLQASGHASATELCRVLSRSHTTGAPVSQRLRRQSQGLRRERRDETLRRVRALGVRAVAPLGLCFLPAFVLLAVVPLAASFATQLVS